jgi:hypothetical protein
MKMHQMATKIGGIVRGVLLTLLFLKEKLTNLNAIKMLLVVLEKQLLKTLLNALMQHTKYIDECPKPMKLTQMKRI